MIMQKEEKEATAYHEAGHALVAYHLEKADPIHKITIIPRGQALGLTSFLPDADRLSLDKEFLLAKITVALGGRAAEEIILHDFSTGVESDIKNATDIAYQMICKWGMSDKLGALSIPQGDSGNFLAIDYNAEEPVSEEMQQIVDNEVQTLILNCYAKAVSILTEKKNQLKALAEALIEKETLTLDQVNDLLNIPATDPITS